MAIKLKYFKTRVVRYPILAIATLAAIVTTGMRFDLDKSDWSGWVQAVGSLAALGIAVFVMARQNQHAIRIVVNTDRRALVRRGKAVSALMFNAHQTIDIFCNDLHAIPFTTRSFDAIRDGLIAGRKSIEEARATLAIVPLHELGSEAMVSGATLMLESMTFICISIDQWLTAPSGNFDLNEGISVAIHFKEMAQKAADMYASGLNALEVAEF